MKTRQLLFTALATAIGAAADSGDGYWKLNPTKSKDVPVRAKILRIEEIEMPGTGVPGFHVITGTIGADGKPTHADMRFGLDGKDYPAADGSACDVYTARRLDGNTVERYCRKGEKTLFTLTRKVAPDGKSLVTISAGTGPDGKPYRRESWYDRWSPEETAARYRRISVGTWKSNPAKSRREPPGRLPDETRVVREQGDALSIQSEGIGADGKPYKRTNVYRLDGRDNPVTGMSNVDTLAQQVLDDRTAILTYKKDGKVWRVGTHTYSADGMTETFETWGTDAQGNVVHSVGVGEKQK